MNEHKKFIIIDANALLHRSFHALPPLTTKQGQLVNAVYGFTSVLLRVLKEFKPAYVVAAFDMKKKTFRHEEYAEYKAGRVKQPDEFYAQIPLAKRVLQAFGIATFEQEGYEADDIIGTVVERNKKLQTHNIIVTGDKDAFQLINSHTTVYTLRKGMNDTVTYDAAMLKERYGLRPEQMIDFKAIAGDPSDNIPGVKGIGEKGALDLLHQFGSLETIYHDLEQKDSSTAVKPRYARLLSAHKEQAMMSQHLATIVRQVPIDYSLEQCALGAYDHDAVMVLFRELEFKSLLARLPDSLSSNKTDKAPHQHQKQETNEPPSPAGQIPGLHASMKAKYQLINTNEEFVKFLSSALQQKRFAFDTESTGLDPFRAQMIGASFCWQEGQAYYLNLKDNPIWRTKLRPLMENPQVKKFGHNLKFDIEMFQQAGIGVAPPFFDSMVASYLLNPGTRGHGLDNLAFEVFGYQMQPITDLIGKGKQQVTMDLVPLDKVAWYAAEDADYTFRLCEYFRTELEEKNLHALFTDIEMPLLPVLASLETNGVKIDSVFLGQLSKEIGHKLQILERKIHRQAGVEFNINSPLQLKEVLFEKLKISTEGIGKTKTGLSTAAAQLDKLRDKHPIVPLLGEYRELSKLQSTYLEALPRIVNPKTGRVHTSFNQTVTATGRLSSSEPNLQNIPIRTEEGKKIRCAFTAEPGFKILSADYSQIELRIVASLAGDEKMIASFKNNEDIHRRTAADIYNIPLDEVTDTQRYEAKEVNFGILYGMGAWGLASRKGMSRERARAFIEKYFYAHQEIQEYLAATITLAHEQGYVETLFGRRRYLPEINSGMPQVRAGAERMAVNMPVQGTAADLLKIAMIKIYQRLPGVSKRTRMILQVHDELVFEVPHADIDKVAEFVRKEMNSAAILKVPIKTEVSVGDNWGSLESIGN